MSPFLSLYFYVDYSEVMTMLKSLAFLCAVAKIIQMEMFILLDCFFVRGSIQALKSIDLSLRYHRAWRKYPDVYESLTAIEQRPDCLGYFLLLSVPSDSEIHP